MFSHVKPLKLVVILLLSCSIIKGFFTEFQTVDDDDPNDMVDIFGELDPVSDDPHDTKDKAEERKTTEEVKIEKDNGDTTQNMEGQVETEEEENPAVEEKPNEENPWLNTFGNMFGDNDLMKGLLANGEANPLKELMPLLKSFGSTLTKQMAEAEKGKDKDGENKSGSQTEPDLSSLVNMFSGLMNPQNKGENENKDAEALFGGEGKENVLKKVLEAVTGQKTALDLVPYLLRDKLSDDLKNKLKEVTEDDLLELKKVYADIENIDDFQDIPKKIEKEAPKVYKTSVELYSQAQIQLAQFVSSLDEEPKNWLNKLTKDVKSLGEKHFDSFSGMSLESYQNIQQAVSKISPEFGRLLSQLTTSQAAVLWYMNNMLQKQLNKMDEEEVRVGEQESDHNEL